MCSTDFHEQWLPAIIFILFFLFQEKKRKKKIVAAVINYLWWSLIIYKLSTGGFYLLLVLTFHCIVFPFYETAYLKYVTCYSLNVGVVGCL